MGSVQDLAVSIARSRIPTTYPPGVSDQARMSWADARSALVSAPRECTSSLCQTNVAAVPFIAVATTEWGGLTALHEQRTRQAQWRATAHGAWLDLGFVFSTPHGTPIEPRNFHPLQGSAARRRQSNARAHHPAHVRHPCSRRLTCTLGRTRKYSGTAKAP